MRVYPRVSGFFAMRHGGITLFTGRNGLCVLTLIHLNLHPDSFLKILSRFLNHAILTRAVIGDNIIAS